MNERVISVHTGSKLAMHIAAILEKFDTNAELEYENVKYRIARLQPSIRQEHVDVRLKRI